MQVAGAVVAYIPLGFHFTSATKPSSNSITQGSFWARSSIREETRQTKRNKKCTRLEECSLSKESEIRKQYLQCIGCDLVDPEHRHGEVQPRQSCRAWSFWEASTTPDIVWLQLSSRIVPHCLYLSGTHWPIDRPITGLTSIFDWLSSRTTIAGWPVHVENWGYVLAVKLEDCQPQTFRLPTSFGVSNWMVTSGLART